MRYCAQYKDDKLIAIGTGYGGTEITKEEYEILLSEIREKATLVDKLYSGEITIEDVKAEWQEEIQRRFEERKTQLETVLTEELSAEEIGSLVKGVLNLKREDVTNFKNALQTMKSFMK